VAFIPFDGGSKDLFIMMLRSRCFFPALSSTFPVLAGSKPGSVHFSFGEPVHLYDFLLLFPAFAAEYEDWPSQLSGSRNSSIISGLLETS
jgi:hypothetical protein